jgi:hypothetical protein
MPRPRWLPNSSSRERGPTPRVARRRRCTRCGWSEVFTRVGGSWSGSKKLRNEANKEEEIKLAPLKTELEEQPSDRNEATAGGEIEDHNRDTDVPSVQRAREDEEFLAPLEVSGNTASKLAG